MDIKKFRDVTATVLGPPQYDANVQDAYKRMAEPLLARGRDALGRWGEVGVEAPLQEWRHCMGSIGRHRGHETEKKVLDIISFETRAALHRCYSATWCELLPHLAKKYNMTPESQAFHRLWHLDQCLPTDDPDVRFHLFHGHVFGLHPASGLFATTSTGAELIGDWLQDPKSEGPFQRLLHGISIATASYAGWRETCATLRTRDAALVTNVDVEALAGARASQSDRRRLRPVQDDD